MDNDIQLNDQEGVSYIDGVGNILSTWDVYDYAPFQRSSTWWRIALICSILIAGLLLWLEGVGSFSMVLALIVFGYVYYKTHAKEETTFVPFAVGDQGILLGKRSVTYDLIRYYHVIHYPDYNVLEFIIKGKRLERRKVYLPIVTDLVGLRNALSEHVEEKSDAQETVISKLLHKIKL